VSEHLCEQFEAWCEEAGVAIEKGERSIMRLAYEYRGPAVGTQTGWMRPRVEAQYVYETRMKFQDDGFILLEERLS